LNDTRNDGDFDSDNSNSDDELGRNPNASPIIKSNQKARSPFGRADRRFEPKMSEVIEETEPESSFKETNRKQNRNRHERKASQENFGMRKKSSDIPQPVPEEPSFEEQELEVPPDRDDDFSDSSDDGERKDALA